MANKTIRLQYARFWRGFDPENNYISCLLRKFGYHICLSENPDYVIYSCFDGSMPLGKYTKIFYTGEARRPVMTEADWAFGFDYEEFINHPRYMRLPLYIVQEWQNHHKLIKGPSYADEVISQKRKFCCFISSHPTPMRKAFFEQISKYKKVDSYGKFLKNVSSLVEHSSVANIDIMRSYKFAIVPEHLEYPGYTSEKIFRAMCAGAIPVYWGNDLIDREFNTRSFINYYDFEGLPERFMRLFGRKVFGVFGEFTRSERPIIRQAYTVRRKAEPYWESAEILIARRNVIKKMVEKIITIDSDDKVYADYLGRPWYHGNSSTMPYSLERLAMRFNIIFGQ